ncbi:MAG: D-alanine--D-alanine ligase [Candidatus Eisenbacteria bacterium]|nr:D-alanine--D-alanine ligase [Candidatus Eisenbacteria bacterium]
MRVGFTFDRKEDHLAGGMAPEQAAEFDGAGTIDAIGRAVASLGHEVDPVGNVKSLVRRLAAGDRWELVFNIAEGVTGFGREAQIPALLEAYGIPYTFSDPLALCVTLHKATAKRVAASLGVPTPPFGVVESEEDIRNIRLPFPLFAKPLAEGSSKGISAASVIRSGAELEAVCRDLLRRFEQPVLVEAYLPGREFTVGVLGTGPGAETLGVLEITLAGNAERGAYSFDNKQRFADRVGYALCDDPALAGACSSVALDAWRALGCRDAGRVDIRLDESGGPQFLEINPLAGLDPVSGDLPILCRSAGVPYETLIKRIIESASRRCEANRPCA